MPNVYYNPEAFGLTPVAELECSSGGYEFDTIVVWSDATGTLLWAHDAGCSCPTPFEDHDVSTLNRDRDALLRFAAEKNTHKSYGGYPTAEDYARFITKVVTHG